MILLLHFSLIPSEKTDRCSGYRLIYTHQIPKNKLQRAANTTTVQIFSNIKQQHMAVLD